MESRRPLIGVVVMRNDQILLGKRKGSHAAGTWAFPGGHLEFGESVEDCARREVLEETGLKVLSLELGPWVANIIDEQKHYVTLFAYVNDFEGELQLLEPDKCEGWHWFSPKELPRPLFPSIESLIQRLAPDFFLRS